MLVLLLGTGCYLMLKLEFIPLKNLKFALECALGFHARNELEDKSEIKNKALKGGVSSFSSLTTELAATIGTGNIVGVATAMLLGGPGALLWMMVSALIGMATKLVESMLSVKYRSVNDRGEYAGGPMYTMVKAFPNKRLGSILALFFAVFAIMASLGMGNMTQSNSIAEAMEVTFHIPAAKTGLVVTIITILVVLGGIQSISKVTQIVVPFMGILYMLGTILVVVKNWSNIPESILKIVVMAFCPQAMAGGVAGSITITMLQSLRYGVSRGVFSNEAGLGAAGISAAAADTDDYIRQGYISMTSVFLDTIVLCSVTGLSFIASGVLGMTDETGELLNGIALTIAAFETTFGQWGAYFISICITLFAFATIVGWAYQGEKAFEFLVGKSRYCIYYRFFYALMAFVGAVCSLELVWEFSDICNGLMAIPNLICVLALSGETCKEIKEYHKRRGRS
ncbi:MAG: alanine:cation symporter family protein [Lachnospiraceae bacterium]|nr:alanine:cation symporter family protein [Lachnospiraceae bacterium]